MNQSFSLKRRALWSATALALCCTLVSCGSDDDGDSDSSSGAESIALNTNRIEPLDTAKRAPAKAQEAAAQPALPATAPVAELVLPAPAAAKTALQAPQKGQPLRIGTARDVADMAGAGEVAQLLQWQPLAGGGLAAALRFVSQGAAGVRLGVDVQALPEGAVLRFYGDEGEVQEVSAEEAARLRAINEEAGLDGEAARLVWSQVIEGDAATLEVELPAGAAPEALTFAVPRLSHLMLTPQKAMLKDTDDIGDSGSCNRNITCQLDDMDMESRAVAKMVFDSGRNTYLCTGTLLNDASSSRTPHFITARHCISTQSEASTLITYWFFHAASCNSANSPASGYRTLRGGARLLTTNATYDTTLLQLNNQPPAGAVYAGSYWGGIGPGVDVLGVHHPSGDLMKYSIGAVNGYGRCDSSDHCTLSNSNNSMPMLRVKWREGTTEQGSSGSGMFVRDSASGTRYLVGVLHGGDASCNNRDGFDVYGRFDRAFADELQNWLAQ